MFDWKERYNGKFEKTYPVSNCRLEATLHPTGNTSNRQEELYEPFICAYYARQYIGVVFNPQKLYNLEDAKNACDVFVKETYTL